MIRYVLKFLFKYLHNPAIFVVPVPSPNKWGGLAAGRASSYETAIAPLNPVLNYIYSGFALGFEEIDKKTMVQCICFMFMQVKPFSYF